MSGVGGLEKELLEAFQECQQGTCTCPTDQYENVASMTVIANERRIAIHLEPKPGAQLEVSEIATCLDYTIGGFEPTR